MDLFFIFKRVVGMAMQPLMLVLALLLAAAFLLARARQKRWRAAGWTMFVLAVTLLALTSWPPLARRTARVLETRYAPLMGEAAAEARPYAIVILGNGVAHPDDPALPALTRLNDTSRARLVEGVRLARLYPEARLITSGYGLGLENCADAMALAAMELGFDENRIDRLAGTLDTDDEARQVAEAVGDRPVILVTTAVHMPRAMESFRRRKVDAVPAPCDFISPVSDEVLSTVDVWRWRPRGIAISENEEMWHEFMGLLYKSWFDGEKAGE